MSKGAYPGHTYRPDYARRRNQQLEYRRRDRAVVLWLLGGCCAACGEADPDVLQVDHIHGAKESARDSSRRSPGIYTLIVTMRRTFDDLQLLCANCNMRKARKGEFFGYKQRRGLVPV